MGDPRFKAGAPYNVGTCTAGGFDSRSGSCGNYNNMIQSYCDVSCASDAALFVVYHERLLTRDPKAADPYCCNGSDAATHQGYATKYGSKAEAFVNGKL